MHRKLGLALKSSVLLFSLITSSVMAQANGKDEGRLDYGIWQAAADATMSYAQQDQKQNKSSFMIACFGGESVVSVFVPNIKSYVGKKIEYQIDNEKWVNGLVGTVIYIEPPDKMPFYQIESKNMKNGKKFLSKLYSGKVFRVRYNKTILATFSLKDFDRYKNIFGCFK